MKGLINIKNKDLKYFMWCHIKLINLTDSHPERVNKQNKKLLLIRLFRFWFSCENTLLWISWTKIWNGCKCFLLWNKIYPIYISKKSNTEVLNVLLNTSKEKSHYVFNKDFDRLKYSKAKTKININFLLYGLFTKFYDLRNTF